MNQNTMKLIENVLDTTIQESRLGKYYKHYEDRTKEIEGKYKDLEDKEKRKIKYFNGNPEKLEDLQRKKELELEDLKTKFSGRPGYRLGMENYKYAANGELDPKFVRTTAKRIKNTNSDTSDLNDKQVKELLLINQNNRPQGKAAGLHDRINKRTAAFDTTAKHEAALILIEALNTLLNE
jgi:hypothetical protein